MGQKLQNDNIPSVVKGSTTTLTLASTFNGKSTRITIGGQQYVVSATITLSTATSGFNGIDTGSFTAGTIYNIFAVTSAGTAGLVISTSSSPTGFTSYKFLGKMIAATGTTISHVMNLGELFVEYLYNTSTSVSASDTTSFGYGVGGVQIQSITANINRTVQSLQAIVSTDSFMLEFWSTVATDYWVPVNGASSGGADNAYKDQNGVTYGISIREDTGSTANTLRVTFGQYAYNTTTYGGTGVSWASAGINVYFWRVKKISGPVLGP